MSEPIFQLAGGKQPRFVPKRRRLISTLLIAAGLMVIALPALTEAYGYFAQARLGRNWEQKLARQERLAAAVEKEQVGRLGNAISEEETVLEDAVNSIKTDEAADFPATKIKIPKLGLDQVIGDDVDIESLKNGPGHYRGTANPGQPGTVGIAGHRVTYTHPFNRVDELAPGDKIILETLDSIYEYRVERSDVLEPSDLSALAPKKDGRARLTLTTCTPKYSARYRLDVQATLVKAAKRYEPTILRRIVKNIAPPARSGGRGNVLDLALERAQKAVSRDPGDANARIGLGIIYNRLGHTKAAADQLRVALDLDPGNPDAHFNLALVYIKRGDNSAAISSLERVVERAPGFESARYRLGDLYLKTEQPGKAIDAFTAALALQPLAGDTYYSLGQAYEMLGDIERATEAYREAMKYIPDVPEVRDALKRVKN